MSINKTKIMLFLSVITMFMTYSYFVWETYDNKSFSLVATIIRYLSLVFLIILLIKRSSSIDNKEIYSNILILIFFSFYIVHYNYFTINAHQSINNSDLILIFYLLLLLFLKENDKQDLFLLIVKSFAIIVLPSIIYFYLKMIGLNIPFSILQSHEEGKLNILYYEHYPLGLLSIHGSHIRPCGIFNEGGVIGTLSALFIAGSYKKINKNWIILLIIEGISSLSLAFILLMAINILIELIKSNMTKKIKNILCIGFGLLVVILLGSNIPLFQSFYERFDFSSNTLFIDNRTSKYFDISFNRFISQGGKALWSGYGKGAYELDPNMAGSCSYKCLLYDFGIIGVFFYVATLVSLLLKYRINRKNVCFVSLFIISLYQRPYIFNVLYIPILISGLSFSTYTDLINKREEE